MFSYFTKNTAFDFVANILSNITNLKEGRKYIIERKSLDSIMKLLMLGESIEANEKLMSAHRRKHLLCALRNVLFEYEKYEKDYQQMRLLEAIISLLVREQGISELNLPDAMFERKIVPAAKELFVD